MLRNIGFNSIATKLIPTIIGLIFVVISSKIIGPNKIGEFIIYLITYNLFKLICEGGFSLVLSDQNYSNEDLYASNLHYIIFGLIGCIIFNTIRFGEININSIILQISLILFCFQIYYQNNLKINLAYGQLSRLASYASLVSILISIILILITENELILYLRYFLFELSMLIFLKKNSKIEYRFGELRRLRLLYKKSLHFLFQGLAESIIELLLASSIRTSVGVESVGYYNRSNQLVDAGIKMPIQGFRAAYIGLITKNDRTTKHGIGFVFLFITLSTIIIFFLSIRGEFIIINLLGPNWLPVLSWLKYGILVAWAYSFEQIATSNMYLLKKEGLITPINILIKLPVCILIFLGFDLNSWYYWSLIYFILTAIYFSTTTIKIYNEYRNCNDMDVPRSGGSF